MVRLPRLTGSYWTHIHPCSTILDPRLCDPDFARRRSSFLFTVVLAIGAMVLATQGDRALPQQAAEVDMLQAHAEKTYLVAHGAGAKSVEIVQAMMVGVMIASADSQVWADSPLAPKTPLDDPRIPRLAGIRAMAAEIGIHLPRRASGNPDLDRLLSQNDIRTRAWLLIFDTKYGRACARLTIRIWAFHGGFMSDLTHFELTARESEILERNYLHDSDYGLPAFYHLHMFQRRMKSRMDAAATADDAELALDAEIALVQAFTDRWVDQWCQRDTDTIRGWIHRHEVLTIQLWLLLRILGKRSHPASADCTRYHREILQVAHDVFENALKQERIPHLSFKTGPVLFASGVILRLGGRRDLILQLALRLAGDPDRPPLNTFTRHNAYQMLSMLT